MSKTKVSSLAGGSAEDTESAFYDALQAGDIEKLMACWADEDDIVCVHPGGGRLVGAGAIRASFEAIFANGSVRARPDRVRVLETVDACIHSVLERVELMAGHEPRYAYVIATNVYQRTAQGWRMLAHHASPGTPRELHEADDSPLMLH